MKSSSKNKWVVAIKEELKALDENGVGTVVVPREDFHVLLHYEWIFKTKTLKLCINSARQAGDPIKIESWSDADFAANKSDPNQCRDAF